MLMFGCLYSMIGDKWLLVRPQLMCCPFLLLLLLPDSSFFFFFCLVPLSSNCGFPAAVTERLDFLKSLEYYTNI